MKIVLMIVSYIVFGILFDLWHKYAYKRIIFYCNFSYLDIALCHKLL